MLVPLGTGSSFASSLLFEHRTTMVTVAGGGIIVLGIVQMAGGGFAFRPAQRILGSISGRSPTSVIALGAVYGLAGFCSGPILGSILTVAGTSGSPASGGALLAVYAFGMAAPLLGLALVWDRWDLGRRRLLRGRQITAGPLRLHTTSLLSGALFVALGAAFLASDGTAGVPLPGRVADAEASAERWVMGTLGSIPDAVLLGALAAVAVLALVVQLWRRTSAADQPESDGGTRSTGDFESGVEDHGNAPWARRRPDGDRTIPT